MPYYASYNLYVKDISDVKKKMLKYVAKYFTVENDCSSSMKSECPEAEKDYPIANPDLDYCKRLEKYKYCAKDTNAKCWEFYNVLSVYICPPNDTCIKEFANMCPSAEKNFPKRNPDKNFCNRLLNFYKCARDMEHSCEKNFGNTYHTVCTHKAGDCEGRYRQICYEAIREYPPSDPDTHQCSRIIEYKKCADKYKDEHCFTYFAGVYKDACPEKYSCIELFKSYCPEAEKDFPVHSPDKDFCKRISLYRTCATQRNHRCTGYFHQIFLLSCNAAGKTDGCEEKYRSICTRTILKYPLRYPDTNLCPRLVEYQKCTEEQGGDGCLKSFQRAFRVACPEKDSCMELFKLHCPEAENNFPIRSPDWNFCKRILIYENFAAVRKHKCTGHFHQISLINCHGGHLGSGNCLRNYSSICQESMEKYPLAYPDKNMCARFTVLENCAEKSKDDKCLALFKKAGIIDCYRPLGTCYDLFQKYCPYVEERFPVRSPDKDYCKRLREYERCAASGNHNCKVHFNYYSQAACAENNFASDCKGMYRSTCYEARRDYPLKRPDTFRCQRLVIYENCAKRFNDTYCIESFQKVYKDTCNKLPKDCNDIMEKYCPQILKETDDCKRIYEYEKCAIKLKHRCSDIYHVHSSFFCSDGHSDAIDCERMYRSLCLEGPNKYPLIHPDTYRCPRLKLFEACAERFRDDHCLEIFTKQYKAECV